MQSTKTERVTLLVSPEFKAFLSREAMQESVSVSELVRRRCENRGASDDEVLLLSLVEEVKQSTGRARRALQKGLQDAEAVLEELRNERD